MLRYFYRIISTGEVLAAAHSTSQPREWIVAYAKALSLNPAEIEEFYSEDDPRADDARKEPEPDAPPPSEREVMGAQMAAMAAALAELRTAFTGNPAVAAAVAKAQGHAEEMTRVIRGA